MPLITQPSLPPPGLSWILGGRRRQERHRMVGVGEAEETTLHGFGDLGLSPSLCAHKLCVLGYHPQPPWATVLSSL